MGDSYCLVCEKNEKTLSLFEALDPWRKCWVIFYSLCSSLSLYILHCKHLHDLPLLVILGGQCYLCKEQIVVSCQGQSMTVTLATCVLVTFIRFHHNYERPAWNIYHGNNHRIQLAHFRDKQTKLITNRSSGLLSNLKWSDIDVMQKDIQ